MNDTARQKNGGVQSPPKNGGVQALWLQVMLFTGARLLIDTNFRMVYPFLATFQTGLGISLAAISVLLTVRALTGFIGPIFAPLADRISRKFSMLLGIGAFAGGALLILLWPGYLTFFIGSILMATAGLIYIPAMQAFISDRVPFVKRGRVLGLTELSWSLAFLIGVPLIGWLLARTNNWTSPFIFFAALGAAFIILLYIIVPRTQPLPADKTAENRGIDLRAALRSPSLLTGLAMAVMMTAGNESINIVFGLWLEKTFQMQLVALGAASMVIGIAEFGGGGLSTLIVDRLGKQRSVGLGMVLNGLAALFLMFFGGVKSSALFGLFCFYLTFEFAVVSAISLMSEALPGLRATALAATVSSFNIGRAVGAALGPLLYVTWGFPVNAAAAVIFNIAAVLLLSRLKIGQKQPQSEIQATHPPV